MQWIDGGVFALWFVTAGYFAHRFAFITRRPITLSLAVVTSCVSGIGLLHPVGDEPLSHGVLRAMLFAGGIFTNASIIHAHLTPAEDLRSGRTRP